MNPNTPVHLSYSIRSKAVGASRSVEVVASTDTVDLGGDAVAQDWDLARYTRNPVVLYMHNFAASNAEETLPIGFSTNIAVREGKLCATLNFVDAQASPLAEKVWQGFQQQSIRAVSVGLRPKVVTTKDVNGSTVFVLSGNELLEISVCPIPMNPDAVAVQRSMSLTALKSSLSSKGLSQMSTTVTKRYEEFTPIERAAMRKADPIGFKAILEEYVARSPDRHDPHAINERVAKASAASAAKEKAARDAYVIGLGVRSKVA